MINRNEFQAVAKRFRGGRISLSDFTSTVFDSMEKIGESKLQSELAPAIEFPRRADNAHKGDCGRVLLIGGSATMPGAIALTALATLRTGSGLATVFTADSAQSIVAGFSPCLMTVGGQSAAGCLSEVALPDIIEHCQTADVIAIGPGMGRTVGGQQIATRVFHDITAPVVVDADAINNLVDAQVDWKQHAGPRVLTPHPGEFARITGSKTNHRGEMENQASEFARSNEIIVLLKGEATFVTDGDRDYRNTTGNSGMATAGSGDVLTGVIASLIGQRLTPLHAAIAGCFIHGLAGDCCESRGALASLIATDLIDALPQAISQLVRLEPGDAVSF